MNLWKNESERLFSSIKINMDLNTKIRSIDDINKYHYIQRWYYVKIYPCIF